MQKAQLFFFHFAGGNIYSFNTITPRLKHVEAIPLELPGRGRRIQERLLKNFDLAAKDLYNQVVPKLNGAPLLIYGHSMGAYLALRVTRMLEEAGHPPAYLIVSGNPGPGVPRKRPGKRYLLGKAAFIEELRTLGGVRKRCSRTRICLGFSSPSCAPTSRLPKPRGWSTSRP
jgi:surfactin synthase thioesterase subunit